MLRSKSKYYYTRLDNNSQGVYNDILSAWEARNPMPSLKVNLTNNNIDIQKIVDCIRYDNPGLFYVDFRSISFVYSATTASLRSNFLYTERQIDDAEKQLETIVAGILASHGFNAMDSYKRELALHDYLVKNVSYSVDGMDTETTSIVGALISRRAVCEGYAKAFKLLCDNAGLSCIIASGKAVPYDGTEELHAWNIVKLDGICAHVDVTWDNTTRGNSDTCYDHFNLTDEDTAKDHTWDRSLLPACTSSQNNYYVKNGQCAGSRNEFKKYVALQAKQGKKTISVRLTGKEASKEQVMEAALEALRDTLNSSFSINLRYNQKRGTAFISIIC
jgi:hypothetical protein